jgi:hypothetical protein
MHTFMNSSHWIPRFCGVAVALMLAGGSFIPNSARAQDDDDDEARIKSPSPNERYALRIKKETRGDEEVARLELIEVATKRPLARLDDPEDGTSDPANAELDWSPDSRRVASYTGGRRGGSTRIFVQKADGFAEVRLPAMPELPKTPSKEVAKKHKGGFPLAETVSDLTFVRWTDSGVVLNRGDYWKSNRGFAHSWDIEITLEIDAKNQAKIVKTTKKETVHED